MSKMKKCKACSKEIATNAKSCPECGAKNKKLIYMVYGLWAIVFIIAIGTGGSDSDTDNSKEINSGNVESVQEVSQSNDENTVIENESEDKTEDAIPEEYKSALKKAKSYTDEMNLSKARLYEMLTVSDYYNDHFTAEAAQYAVDNVGVDWKESALKRAKLYRKAVSLSTEGIYDELTAMEYTEEEIQYAIDNLDK